MFFRKLSSQKNYELKINNLFKKLNIKQNDFYFN